MTAKPNQKIVFLASYMMEVEDDNAYIERMTTDVSGNSGLDGQSEEKFYEFASMDATFEVL